MAVLDSRGVRSWGSFVELLLMLTFIQFWQGIGNAEYLMHLFSIFESSCRTPPKVSTFSLNSTGKSYQNYCTLSSPLFTEFLDLFYPCGKKRVPPNIGELLTARGLAYWAMDDGVKKARALFYVPRGVLHPRSCTSCKL
jgi:hypothetical protein